MDNTTPPTNITPVTPTVLSDTNNVATQKPFLPLPYASPATVTRDPHTPTANESVLVSGPLPKARKTIKRVTPIRVKQVSPIIPVFIETRVNPKCTTPECFRDAGHQLPHLDINGHSWS